MDYRIEFNGSVLPGFDLQTVRQQVAIRLKLRDEQLTRLFSGQTVVLKKLISQQNSQAYLTELRSLGMDARLVPLSSSEPLQHTEGAEYKVVFWGRVLPGFERTGVMAAAAKRLRVSPTQLMQMFAGSKVVLKRRVGAEQGARLVVDLALIGMQIELEMELPAPAAPQKTKPVQAPTSETEDDPQYGALLRTSCDLSGTAFSGYDSSSAEDMDEPLPVIKPPVMPVQRNTDGYSAANQVDHMNCPRCGFYQAQSPQCIKCGVELPQRKLWVGKQGAFNDSSPTVVVSPTEGQASTLLPQERRTVAPSLRDEMGFDDEEQPAAERSSRMLRWIAGLILAAAALAIVILIR